MAKFSQVQKGDVWKVGWDLIFQINNKLLNRPATGPWLTLNNMTPDLLWVSHKPPTVGLHVESKSIPRSQPTTSRYDLILFNEAETRQILHETSQPSFRMRLGSYWWIYVVKITSPEEPNMIHHIPQPQAFAWTSPRRILPEYFLNILWHKTHSKIILSWP